MFEELRLLQVPITEIDRETFVKASRRYGYEVVGVLGI